MKRLSVLFAITAIFALPMVACGDDDGGTQEICGNNIDDDGNGLTDCYDSACANTTFCQTTCGNGTCETGETATNCMADCHCGNLICDSAAPYSETTTSCPSDCTANPCDNDDVCDVGENTTNCPNDCPAAACDNDNVCDVGENTANCPNDCPAAGDCLTAADLVDTGACDAGDKCAIVDENGGVDCVAAGTAGAFETCTAGNPDNCEAGSFCGAMNQGDPTVCFPFCDDTHACPTDSTCSISMPVGTDSVSLCFETTDCDLVDNTGCDAGDACYIADQAGATSCFTAGTGGVGTDCTYLNDCAGGLLCAGDPSTCMELCYDNTDCTSGTCQGIGEYVPNSTWGVCQ